MVQNICCCKFLTDAVHVTLGRLYHIPESLLLVNILQGVLDGGEAVHDDCLQVPDAGVCDLTALIGVL